MQLAFIRIHTKAKAYYRLAARVGCICQRWLSCQINYYRYGTANEYARNLLKTSQVLELKETITDLIHKALIPLKAYAEIYERYTNLMNLNVDQYIKYIIFIF